MRTTRPARFVRKLVVPALLAAALPACGAGPPPSRHLLIVVDGLRPDAVTDEVMPTLSALGRRGAVFRRHHAVYPTVTRVNAASISSGAYPGGHGLLGNSVFFPRVDPAAFLDTSDRGNLLKIEAAEGRLLTVPTLGESLQAAGRRMLVVSSGSTGSALLNNHTVAGGAILHHRYVLPEALGEQMKAVGPPPPDDAPAAALDRYAVDAFLTVGVLLVDPSVTVMWLGAHDSIAHANGIGHPATMDALRSVDREIERIESGLRAAGLFDRYNIWVTSDHGFSTHTGAVDLGAILAPFASALPDGSPRIVNGSGAVYVRDADEAVIGAIVARLQQSPGIGAIFTGAAQPGSLDGRVPGTLSFDAVRWAHDRAAQILFSPDWTDATNAHGIRGTVASGGVAGHGSSSPWDIHNTLVAAGPDVRAGVTIDSPSANVDLAPTFLHLLGITVPPSVQGRPLDEALAAGGGLGADPVRTVEHTSRTPDGAYAVTGDFSIVTVGGKEYRYFDGTRVVRR
jgi:arylsulfatase A-like enzyme